MVFLVIWNKGILKVEFVTPDVVRVQYGENTFIGNGTDVYLPRAVDNPRSLGIYPKSGLLFIKIG